MPSAFDLFGSFENSLRTYHKPQWRFKPCPHGIHVPEHCTCDPNHECKRPHCANDVPLDPTCRLSIGTPFGPMISITDSPPHKCHSSGCAPSTPTTPTKSPVPFAVVDRLYSTRTHASAAKMKGGGASHEDASDDGGVNGSVGGKSGSRLISQLIGDQAFGSHDRTRRDGASPSPTRRAQSIGVRRAATFTPADLSTPSRRSHSSHATVKSTARAASKPRRGRGSESDASSELSSSPETSPGSTPSPTPSSTPRKHLSPKNSGAQLLPARTPSIKRNAKTPYARPSAVFCGGGGGGRGKIKPTPLNKSASDGVERARSSVGLRSGKGKGEGLLPAGEKKILNDDLLTQQLHNKLARVSSDSRVDELLAQAYMALESLTPEPSAGGPVVAERAPASPHAGTDALRRLAIAHARKENGKSYKDLTQILQEKIQELDNAVVSVCHNCEAARHDLTSQYGRTAITLRKDFVKRMHNEKENSSIGRIFIEKSVIRMLFMGGPACVCV
ncbi:uncharacterized protein [Penaeus vannamei]|uniref:uncharacterized protein n=1 Tax=Penaeus vannamei TaxID=6689 RepID=UPI00387F9DC9